MRKKSPKGIPVKGWAKFKYWYVDEAVERTQLILHLCRSIASPSRRPVSVRRVARMFEIQVDGQVIFSPWIRRWRRYRGGFEAGLSAAAHRYQLHDLHPESPDDWAIDVGAHIGEWSIVMLRRGFNLLAIEPDLEVAQCLTANLTRHAPLFPGEWKIDTRVCHERAGPVTFYSASHSADSSIFLPKRYGTRVTLDAERLDAIVANRIGDSPVQALKMDAEGAEPEVLAGAPELLRRCRHVSIDTSPERLGVTTFKECRQILLGAGFSLTPSRDIPSLDIVRGSRLTPVD